jgi:hypothetical protein
MRALLSLGALLVVMLVTWQLAGRQVQQVARPVGGQSTAAQAAAEIQKAMEQGAAARASDAEQ